jgi:hypothetical protein
MKGIGIRPKLGNNEGGALLHQAGTVSTSMV